MSPNRGPKLAYFLKFSAPSLFIQRPSRFNRKYNFFFVDFHFVSRVQELPGSRPGAAREPPGSGGPAREPPGSRPGAAREPPGSHCRYRDGTPSQANALAKTSANKKNNQNRRIASECEYLQNLLSWPFSASWGRLAQLCWLHLWAGRAAHR
jgi:hypothetical protein